jgi:LacI family transcriptional regulator
MGVIGFDESPYYELMNPAITSVVQPLNEMADRMVDLLMAQLNNNDSGILTNKTIQLNARLVPRNSTAKNKY